MPNRRLIFTLFILLTHLASAQESRPPNFIIIFADDLGYGDLSCFGHPTIKTPNLDQMAAEGQKWTQFYVAAPICTPSRAALMTGRYPYRNGMSSPERGVLFPDSAGGLPEEEVTIAEVLKQKDYATAAIGKWHLGHLPPYLPTRQGFDYYYGIPYSNDMDRVEGSPSYWREARRDPDYKADYQGFNVPIMEDEQVVERPADQNTYTRRCTEKALKFIESNKDRPFFLYLAHNQPHIPLFAEEEFRGSSSYGLYGDVVQEIDWSVGRILEMVRQLGLEEHTVVMFSSDNGPWLTFETHGGSAGHLRAGKGTTFEGGQRVPTVFWGPKYVKPGIVHKMGATLDVIHTFAALSGTAIPDDRKMDGFDLSPVLKGENENPRKEFFYWTRGVLHAVRSGRWKLHVLQREPVNYGKTVELEHPQLYDLQADIGERYDRYSDHPDTVARLLRRLEEHRADMADALPDQLVERIEEK